MNAKYEDFQKNVAGRVEAADCVRPSQCAIVARILKREINKSTKEDVLLV